jgi:hypothetical protein
VGFRLIFCNVHRARCTAGQAHDERIETNPQNYPQTRGPFAQARFNLLRSSGRVSSVLRSVAFGSAECDDRQGQMGLDAVAATGVASCGWFDPGSKLRVAARGT